MNVSRPFLGTHNGSFTAALWGIWDLDFVGYGTSGFSLGHEMEEQELCYKSSLLDYIGSLQLVNYLFTYLF